MAVGESRGSDSSLMVSQQAIEVLSRMTLFGLRDKIIRMLNNNSGSSAAAAGAGGDRPRLWLSQSQSRAMQSRLLAGC